MQDTRNLSLKALSLGLTDKINLTFQNAGWKYLNRCLVKSALWSKPVFEFYHYGQLYLPFFYTFNLKNQNLNFPKEILNFHLNLTKLQPHFSLLGLDQKVLKTYSFGSILRLYLLKTKRLRRDTKRISVGLNFFTKYYNQKFNKAQTYIVIKGYKKRYEFFLKTQLSEFAKTHGTSVVFLLKYLTGFFLFRRVKAIKKRIRKRLNRPKY